MNELMRKHGKWILAIMGVVLMVIWTLPNKSQSGSDQAAAIVRGKLNGTKVTNADLAGARNDVRMLESLAQSVEYYARQNKNMSGYSLAYQIQGFISRLDPRHPEIHLFLLLKEAQQYGLGATADEVNGLLAQMGMNQEEFEKFLKNLGADGSMLRRALGDYVTVEKLNGLAAGAVRPSVPELAYLANMTQATVAVRYLTLDARDLAKDLPEPTPEEIQKQFEMYKGIVAPAANQTPAEVEGHRFPFGYKFPDRVRLEWLKFDRAKLLQSLKEKQTKEDAQTAWDYYKSHPEEFKVDAATAQPENTTQPANGVKPFDAVKADLLKRVLEGRAVKQLKQMTDQVVNASNDVWRNIDKDGYREAVDQNKWVRYEKQAGDIHKRFGYQPEAGNSPVLLGQEGIKSLQGIGGAAFVNRETRMELGVADMALHVKEIAEGKKEKNPILRNMQVGVEGPVVIDEQGNWYVWRVTEAEKSREAKNLEEVKDQVVRDVQRRKTFDKDVRVGRDLAGEVALKGIETVVEQRKMKLVDSPAFSRMKAPTMMTYMGPQLVGPAEPSEVPGVGVVPAFVETAFALSEKIGGSAATTSAPATQGALPAGEPFVVREVAGKPTPHVAGSVGSEAKLKVFVMELKDAQPVKQEEFESLGKRQTLNELARMDSREVFGPKWAKLEEAAKRLKFVPEQPFHENE